MKPEEVFFLSNGRVAFEHAWIVLKMTMEESRQTETVHHSGTIIQ